MASFTGAAGLVHWDSDNIGELTSFTVDETSEPVECTTITSSFRAYKPGINAWSGSAEVQWSDDDTGQVALWTELATPVEKTLTFYPEGNTSGDITYSGNALITSMNVTSSVNSMITTSISFQGTGGLTKATA